MNSILRRKISVFDSYLLVILHVSIYIIILRNCNKSFLLIYSDTQIKLILYLKLQMQLNYWVIWMISNLSGYLHDWRKMQRMAKVRKEEHLSSWKEILIFWVTNRICYTIKFIYWLYMSIYSSRLQYIFHLWSFHTVIL